MLSSKDISSQMLHIKPFRDRIQAMEKAEIKRIGDFLKDVYEGICEQDPPETQQLQLNELYRIIKRLMDLTSKAPKQEKQFFAMLEYNPLKLALTGGGSVD